MDPVAAIPLRGVRVRNLRGIDVDIPLRRLTVVCGVSGAGKSSLVFETLFAESQRRYLQSFSVRTRQALERFDKPDADRIGNLPPAIAMAHRTPAPRGATVGSLTELADLVRLLLLRAGALHCRQCGEEVRPADVPQVLQFVRTLPEASRISIGFPSAPDEGESAQAWAARLIEQGYVRVQAGDAVVRLGEDAVPNLPAGATAHVILDRVETGKTLPERIADSIETAFRRGADRMTLHLGTAIRTFDRRWTCPRCATVHAPPEPGWLEPNHPSGSCPTCRGAGIVEGDVPCGSCDGTGLGERARWLRWRGRTLPELARLPLHALRGSLAVADPAPIEQPILDAMIRRIDLLGSMGLDHLDMARRADAVAFGELQRIRFAASANSELVDVLHLLDEPTAGLHPADRTALVARILALRDAGNTVVAIDHDPVLAARADWVIQLGPGAGEEGGRVVYQGPPVPSTEADPPETPGEAASEPSAPRTIANEPGLRLENVRLRNLQIDRIDFPLGKICAVVGISGSGKTTLVRDVLFPLVSSAKAKKGASPTSSAKLTGAESVGDVVLMDQTPLSRTARSNPVTYLKIFDEIRECFADVADAKIRNLDAGKFSFNQPGGRCETCEGQGVLAVDMQFLADVRMTCPECQGKRYRREVLEIKVRGLSIADVLELSVREAFRFFRAQRNIERRLKPLLDVGLDYLRLGQPLESLSGGEGQRLKLAGHLAASRKPRTLYLLLDPTAGLHPDDIAQLLVCLQRLTQEGHSVVAADHSVDFMLGADRLIELGPGAGPRGGRVVAVGTPAECSAWPTATGNALRTAALRNAAQRIASR